ncbi:hypothetical protein BG95_07520 [Thermosipho sp. 1063]|uniref:DUF4438 domain-containing protein n=1 Tax=unclassified Thermosipho (in: thermotogales) TaxID=2676525 RepID=UPI00094935D6|nr:MULTISPECIES: DUF4438 domain-containing protein [unclassified Thermosipho (in: thermotogales)]ANQ54262.1 hypothetical protein Y592_07605 [Thermosipho sp. 1070]APT72707.1 hypothetical protein BG95_07520 [Thermosipho sp. 1063]OOC42097.1 hypothetical protein XO08_07355 [Thermosipho sp. 1074]
MILNDSKVVKLSLLVEIVHPIARIPVLNNDGKPYYFPGVGGISYNFGLGDNVFEIFGDHVEPDVSTKNKDKVFNDTCMNLACIGNKAVVVSGEAKGMEGYVIGKHGGVDNILIYFPQKDKLVIGDKIQICGFGQGLEIIDYPDLKVFNIDPNLLKKISIIEKNGKLIFPVKAIVPSYLMGSGVGASNPTGTDYDINTHDMDEIKRLGLDKLKIGDFVAIKDHYNGYGVGGFRKGAISIGVVVHSNCIKTGHGPGIVVVMTANDNNKLDIELKDEVNLKMFLE